jgi:hypothetical protein
MLFMVYLTTLSVDQIYQSLPTCGPRTPVGPRVRQNGSAASKWLGNTEIYRQTVRWYVYNDLEIMWEEAVTAS